MRRMHNDEFSKLSAGARIIQNSDGMQLSCDSSFFSPSNTNVPPASAIMANVSSASAGFIIQDEGSNEGEEHHVNKEP